MRKKEDLMETVKPRLRDPAIDYLKAIAVFGVIIIHTSTEGYLLPVGSFNWGSAVFWSSLVRASVPIFLMCSGALLLRPQKEMGLRKLFLHNLLRIIVAMFGWAMVYKFYHLLAAGTLSFASVYESVKEVLLFKQEFHFYYLHIVILVYLFLPITRVLINHANKRQLQYTLLIWFIFGIVYPTVKTFWPFTLLTGIPSQWLMNMAYASIGYGILGFYIETYPLPKKVYWVCSIAGFAFVFGGTYFMSMNNGQIYTNFFEGMSIGVALLATGVFGLCISLKDKEWLKRCRAVNFLSKASFCIYLVHVLILYCLKSLGLDVNDLPCIVSIPLLSAFNLAISSLVYLVLSKIPVVNRWLI